MSESIINKAKQGLINPCFVNLSFMYFSNKCEANNKFSQKIALTSEDINKGSVTINNKIPNMAFDKKCEAIQMRGQEEQEIDFQKSEIDLRVASGNKQSVEVKWISQYDTIQVDKAGDGACKRACEAIMSQLDIKVENPSNKKITYQVAIEKDMAYSTKSKSYQRDKAIKIVDTSNQDEYIQIDTQSFQAGLAYLDSELEKGYPIVVGVDHSYAYNGGGYNNDLTTDHFVVIVGRGYDEQGLFYRYYEVGTNHEYKGISDDNKLHIKNNQSLEGTSFLKHTNKTNKHYFVTQIRKNLSYK